MCVDFACCLPLRMCQWRETWGLWFNQGKVGEEGRGWGRENFPSPCLFIQQVSAGVPRRTWDLEKYFLELNVLLCRVVLKGEWTHSTHSFIRWVFIEFLLIAEEPSTNDRKCLLLWNLHSSGLGSIDHTKLSKPGTVTSKLSVMFISPQGPPGTDCKFFSSRLSMNSVREFRKGKRGLRAATLELR